MKQQVILYLYIDNCFNNKRILNITNNLILLFKFFLEPCLDYLKKSTELKQKSPPNIFNDNAYCVYFEVTKTWGDSFLTGYTINDSIVKQLGFVLQCLTWFGNQPQPF